MDVAVMVPQSSIAIAIAPGKLLHDKHKSNIAVWGER